MSTSTLSAERFFGTDGVRGAFGSFPLDRLSVHRLGRQLGLGLAGSGPVRVVLGGDTRESTPILCRWLWQGLREGRGERPLELVFLGTVPTPAVAYTVRRLGAALGLAVSASHNPHPDNGIKLIDAEGHKWAPEAERRVAAALLSDPAPAPAAETPAPEVDRDAVEAYLDSLAASLPEGEPLAGLKIALDMANGAASAFGRHLFEQLGAETFSIHAEPDGRNINLDCGSTRPLTIAAHTLETGADLGFAFDGDADRTILIDEVGEVRDGDAMLYLWARGLEAEGRLPRRAIVATSMSNLGLEVALRRHGIEVLRCDVGDREVVAMLRREGIVLGGEQSGHLVNLELSTTGDGLLTALQIAQLRQLAGRPVSRMLRGFERFPQLLRNVPVERKVDFEELPAVASARARVEASLGTAGRLVLRYSGTEPLARIMIEGPDPAAIEALAEDLAGVLAQELA